MFLPSECQARRPKIPFCWGASPRWVNTVLYVWYMKSIWRFDRRVTASVLPSDYIGRADQLVLLLVNYGCAFDIGVSHRKYSISLSFRELTNRHLWFGRINSAIAEAIIWSVDVRPSGDDIKSLRTRFIQHQNVCSFNGKGFSRTLRVWTKIDMVSVRSSSVLRFLYFFLFQGYLTLQ